MKTYAGSSHTAIVDLLLDVYGYACHPSLRQSGVHIIKAVDPFFCDVFTGVKLAEVRLADRLYQKDDVLVIRHYDLAMDCPWGHLGVIARVRRVYDLGSLGLSRVCDLDSLGLALSPTYLMPIQILSRFAIEPYVTRDDIEEVAAQLGGSFEGPGYHARPI